MDTSRAAHCITRTRVFFNFNCVGALILAGVRIGARAVIRVGTLVTRDVPDVC